MRRTFSSTAYGCGRLTRTALVLFVALIGASWSGQARSEPITARYQWVATTEQPDGGYAATFTFNFTNNGGVDFNDLRVRIIDSPPYSMTLPSYDLVVGSLLAGGATSGSWDILFPHPVEVMNNLFFLGEAAEADGTGERQLIMIRQEGAVQ